MIRAFVTIVVIGACCAALLVATDALTRPDIEFARQARARALAESLLGAPLPGHMNPAAQQFGECPAWLFRRYQANGYAGPIDMLAFYRRGALSLRVTAHRETPGIGDFIDHTRSPWLSNLDGKTAADWQALDAVSGATITSEAIRRAADELSAIFSREVETCDG